MSSTPKESADNVCSKSLILVDTLKEMKLKRRLVTFYEKHCPEKLNEAPKNVDIIVRRFKNRPDKVEELFGRLKRKYVDSKGHGRKRSTSAGKKKRKKSDISADGESSSGNLFDDDKRRQYAGPPSSSVKISDSKVKKEKEDDDEHDSNRMVKLENGLEYRTMREGGRGGPRAKRGSMVTMKYEGFLTARGGGIGDMFDSGRFTFAVGRGQVIEGFDLGVMSMQQGAVRRLFVPSHLGYGATGAPPQIPPHADLLFEVELVRIGSRRGQIREQQRKLRRGRKGDNGGGGGSTSRSRKRARKRRAKGR